MGHVIPCLCTVKAIGVWYTKTLGLALQIQCNQSVKMLMLSVLLGLAFVLVVPSVAQPTGTRCPSAPGRSETCVCKTDKGIIDVTPLSRKDGTAR